MPSCSPPLVSRLATPVWRTSRPFLFETRRQSLPDLVDVQAARQQALLGRVAQDEADGRLKRRAPDPISLAVGGVRRGDIGLPEKAYQLEDQVRPAPRQLAPDRHEMIDRHEAVLAPERLGGGVEIGEHRP